MCGSDKPATTGPSLYERVGGVNNIAVLVDDIIERSYVDPVLHANPKIAEAHKRFPNLCTSSMRQRWRARFLAGRRNIRDVR